MLLKSTFSLPQSSGFVAFDGGGTTHPEVQRRAHPPADAVVSPRFEPELVRSVGAAPEANAWQGSRTWQPATGALVRRVEGVVIAAICAYFAFGLASVAGWL